MKINENFENYKHDLIGIVIISHMTAILFMAIASCESKSGRIIFSISLFYKIITKFCIGALILTVPITCLCYFIKHVNKEPIETYSRLLALRYSNWRQAKNVSTILPRLQDFFFYVLKKNNEFLHLPLGQDGSVLSLAKAETVFRDNCIFYQYQLILAEDIEQDVKILQKLIQQFIYEELRNYGIIGLYSTYLDNKTGSWFTVYLDRIMINADEHLITFDLLYISSRISLEYFQKAVQRDNAQLTAEPEVFDDEL